VQYIEKEKVEGGGRREKEKHLKRKGEKKT
jgi:hypothetical protein